MLSMKDTGLVSGVPLAQTPLTTVKCLRGFFGGDGNVHNAGDFYQCGEREARALIATNKAERVEAPTPAPAPVPAIEVATPNREPEPTPEPTPESEAEPEPEPETEARTTRRRKHGA